MITGVGGFIGSNILEELLKLNQKVIGIDNFSTGHKKNLVDVQKLVSFKQWSNFKFLKGDIIDFKFCRKVVKKVDFVLHQAALGSVPRSIKDPISSNKNNVTGFLNMLHASNLSKVKNFVYASSSSVYGDHPKLPKIENITGNLLSPYAATKHTNEVYADVFSKSYGLNCVGLRYFNVFGKRQDPNGSYAAVIPKWIKLIIENKDLYIFGDGTTSRDFCYIENAVFANILACLKNKNKHQIYNIAAGERTTLNDLFYQIKMIASKYGINFPQQKLNYQNFRNGDVKHSLANIKKARKGLSYHPLYFVKEGLEKTFQWYLKRNV